MKTRYPWFSLPQFLKTLFTSQAGAIKNYTTIFLAGDVPLQLMDIWWDESQAKTKFHDWVVKKAGTVCAQECSWLTDQASNGPHFADAKFLRVTPNEMMVTLVKSFFLHDLMERYRQVTPQLQSFLHMVIGKDGSGSDPPSRTGRNIDIVSIVFMAIICTICLCLTQGCTTLISMILNQRSRLITYHASINALVLWDNQVPKRGIQLLNRVGWCTSHRSTGRYVRQLGCDAIRLARDAAIDPSKVKLLPYDNFNWSVRAWEVSAMHRTAQHDQVSAMLVVLHQEQPFFNNMDSSGGAVPSAQHLASVERFVSQMGHRHKLSPDDALKNIMLHQEDHQTFRELASIHVAHILTEEIESFRVLQSTIPEFKDLNAIPPHKTECNYLPTFDQEQGSTRGNMAVLEHYFLNVLKIPKLVFERTMYFVLGDQLTTARDRAAQDQRAVDQSDYHVDHLSSFAMTSGLMHVCLNFIINVGKNLWGETSNDPTSLRLHCDMLPGHAEINLRKVDFYAWLRFLDAILQALVLSAAVSTQNMDSLSSLEQANMSPPQFCALSYQIVDSCLIAPLDRLEADGIKVIEGETHSGHAILTMHDLMMLREMRHAIKHGHPTRIFRMLKYWTPMFYAGLSYNYANECMEITHNMVHDWPSDSAKILFARMLVNNSGRHDGFVETDLNCEHLNKQIQGLT